MASSLESLMAYAGPPLGRRNAHLQLDGYPVAPGLGAQLFELLSLRNGFLAFEGALHVLSSPGDHPNCDLEMWNAQDYWKACYRGLANELFAFAQDLFGGQYCLASEGVFRFDPETAERTLYARDVEDWAAHVIADPGYSTGVPLAREWITLDGAIPVGTRLVPKIPFVLGGEFELSNLHLLDAREALCFYGDLAVQLVGIPDKSQVRLRVTE